MEQVSGEVILQEVSRILDTVECDYLLAIFPVEEASNTTASVGLNLSDADYAAKIFSKLVMKGGDMGWSLLQLLQKLCRQFPVPLHHLLSASHADYKEMTELYKQGRLLSIDDGSGRTKVKLKY